MEAKIEEALRKVWRNARKKSMEQALAQLDELERFVVARSRGKRDHYLARIASSRLVFLVFRDRPVMECVPLVEMILGSEEPTDEVLGRVGTFALHCEEHGTNELGASYLRIALSRARRDGVSTEQIALYESVLERLAR